MHAAFHEHCNKVIRLIGILVLIKGQLDKSFVSIRKLNCFTGSNVISAFQMIHVIAKHRISEVFY